MSELENTIEEEASAPESVSSDVGSKTNRPLDDLIEADKYLASKEAAESNPARMGFRLGVFRSPGHL